LCNGLYGMFANLDLSVDVIQSDNRASHENHARASQVLMSSAAAILIRPKTLFDSFQYCANVASCYDYKSQSACKVFRILAGKKKDCEWVWLNTTITWAESAGQLIPHCRIVGFAMTLNSTGSPLYANPLDSCALFGAGCNYQGFCF